ncbi:MAG: sigma-70 family RNA polymerase sigma factor [Chthoniobacterales bacterium]
MNASPEPVALHPAARELPLEKITPRQEALPGLLLACIKRVRSWRVPPNWSRFDWFQEVEGVEAIAAWQAECDYDATSGIQFAAFIYQRIMARALARYRQEWTYALHFVPEDSDGDMAIRRDCVECAPAASPSNCGAVSAYEELRELVAALAEPDRELVALLFWEGNTEAQIARKLKINQSTVSRRKNAVFKRLSGLLNAEKKAIGSRIKRDVSCNMLGKGDLQDGSLMTTSSMIGKCSYPALKEVDNNDVTSD